jgi:hypothetical protein
MSVQWTLLVDTRESKRDQWLEYWTTHARSLGVQVRTLPQGDFWWVRGPVEPHACLTTLQPVVIIERKTYSDGMQSHQKNYLYDQLLDAKLAHPGACVWLALDSLKGTTRLDAVAQKRWTSITTRLALQGGIPTIYVYDWAAWIVRTLQYLAECLGTTAPEGCATQGLTTLEVRARAEPYKRSRERDPWRAQLMQLPGFGRQTVDRLYALYSTKQALHAAYPSGNGTELVRRLSQIKVGQRLGAARAQALMSLAY